MTDALIFPPEASTDTWPLIERCVLAIGPEREHT
jgi:hypothetical protein